MIYIINLLAFLAGLFASLPSFYFAKNLYHRNKFYTVMTLLLSFTFVFHAFYHLFLNFNNLLLVSEVLETVSAFLLLIYIIMYTSNGGRNNL